MKRNLVKKFLKWPPVVIFSLLYGVLFSRKRWITLLPECGNPWYMQIWFSRPARFGRAPWYVPEGVGQDTPFGGTRTDRVRGFRTNAAYAAAKTGLSSLILSTAQGYASRGITCNGICPGFVDSGAYTTEKRRSLEQKSPLSKLVDEGEIVSAAEFLLKNPSINGTIVRVDQGWSPSFI